MSLIIPCTLFLCSPTGFRNLEKGHFLNSVPTGYTLLVTTYWLSLKSPWLVHGSEHARRVGKDGGMGGGGY